MSMLTGGASHAAVRNGNTALPTACHILHSLNVGGAEMLAAQLARKLRDSYRCVFACLDELGTLGAELRADGFQVEVLGRRPGVDWLCVYRLARLICRERIDLLHAHQYTPFFYSMMARFVAKKAPVLFTEHGRHFPDYPRRKRMLVNRLLLGRRDRVVGVGQAVRQALIANEGIPARRVSVIYNGIDARAFSNNAGERASVRQKMGVGPNDFLIVQVARLDYLKDHATAIRALARVKAKNAATRLVLIGEGPERDKIEAEMHRLDLAEHVRFLGLRQDVARCLSAADLFLLTSISEGIPLTVIEAMSAGLPVVATRVGGVPEVVEEGRTGMLADAGDDADLADCILRLAGDVDRRRSMGERGAERARRLFSQSRMHADYSELYREMLNA